MTVENYEPQALGALHDALENLLRRTPLTERLADDPLQFPHGYASRRDREIVGWLAAGLAYGRRDYFQPVLRSIFQRMGNRPWLFIKKMRLPSETTYFDDLLYRFNNGRDLAAVMAVLQEIYTGWPSLESYFRHFMPEPEADTVLPALQGALADMRRRLTLILGKYPDLDRHVRNPFFLLPDAGGPGPCKRPLMFLRWMVRRESPDLGLWTSFSPARLVVPLDTHLFRVSRRLGLTDRRRPDRQASLEITAFFRRLCPADPVRYDFPLMLFGAETCTVEPSCARITAKGACPLGPFCRRSPDTG
ncbi:MAG: TIGR02757 family protein [Acidobacteria bacterium]|nr:TIGR02757 family protein [Acidobacteriota bacterium]